MKNKYLMTMSAWLCVGIIVFANNMQSKDPVSSSRERICLNMGWRYQKNDPQQTVGQLDYIRLKPYLLPCANDFIKTGEKYKRPVGNPGDTHPYVKPEFDDSNWRELNLPHDCAVEEPFNIDYEGPTGKKDYRLDNWFGTYNRSGTPVDILVKVMGNVSDTTSLTTSYNGGPYLGTSMIRIPEMYYIMSEALLATGNAEGAMEYLDAVVDARGMEKFADRTPLVDITLSDIMAERRKEFIGEGQWWFCLKRLNSPVKLSGATGATIPGSDKIYVLPLPVEEEDYRPE